ncbi:MAG: hypothetical protein ACTHNP_04795 [Solirubrobacterales bacterium]
MEGTFREIVAFALAAIPGVILLEILEYGRPRLRERNGARAVASYLILSLLVWVLALLLFKADGHMAAVIDAADKSGQLQIQAYDALAWRLLGSSLILGLAMRLLLWVLARAALAVESKRRADNPRALGVWGDALMQTISFAFAWDRLLERLNRSAVPQIVHVRFRDGKELYGVLAAGGSADFQADGRGLVLDAELLRVDGRLEQIPNSSGVFIASDAVASVAFVEYSTSEEGDTLPSDEPETR